ncbi:MAG: nuclease-related domain-containing protein [Methanocorpusculum sp.]|nr:nuclease-related domain-containing protein [Methanocorpusculum sp.]
MKEDTLPHMRGKEGEEMLRRVLADRCGWVYASAAPLYLPTADKNWAEIDALCIHPTGLYVFENKYMAGSVSGRMRDRLWMRTGDTVLSFPNPVLQNRKHLLTAAEFFGVAPKYAVSIVVFNDGCDISRVEQDTRECILVKLSDVSAALRPMFARPSVFSASEMAEFCQKARRAESSGAKAAEEHRASIREGKQRRRSEKKRGRMN